MSSGTELSPVAVASAAAAGCAVLLLLAGRPVPWTGTRRRREPSSRAGRSSRRRRWPSRRASSVVDPRDVPLAADLVVAGLEAGVPLWSAVEAAGRAVGGTLGDMLVEARRRQQVGADASTATTLLRADEVSARMGRALARAGSSGASPVQVLAAAAEAERGRSRSQAVSSARTAGSLAALPLGLLFLPAFVLVAVVPVVVGSLSSLLGSG
jgi:pilus assembly protein TadC